MLPNSRSCQHLMSTCRNGRPKNRTTGVPARIMTGYGTEGPQRGIAAQIGWVATLQPSWSLFYSMWRSAILRIALELHEVWALPFLSSDLTATPTITIQQLLSDYDVKNTQTAAFSMEAALQAWHKQIDWMTILANMHFSFNNYETMNTLHLKEDN